MQCATCKQPLTDYLGYDEKGFHCYQCSKTHKIKPWYWKENVMGKWEDYIRKDR